MAAEPLPDVLPSRVRRLDPIAGTVGGEEGVAGAVEGVELVDLAQARQLLFQLDGVSRRWVCVISPEETEEGGRECRRQADDRCHLHGRLRRRRAHYEGTVAVDGGLEVEAAGGEERLAAARAVADDADPAVGGG